MRFTIRDVLWLMVVVGLGIVWQRDSTALKSERKAWEAEKLAILNQRDADVANERRLAELRAREMAGEMLTPPGPADTYIGGGRFRVEPRNSRQPIVP